LKHYKLPARTCREFFFGEQKRQLSVLKKAHQLGFELVDVTGPEPLPDLDVYQCATF